MLADKGPVAIFGWEGRFIIKGETQRGRVGPERHIGHQGFFDEVGPLVPAARLLVLAEVGVRPAVETAFPHAGEVVGHQLVAQFVALVHHDPELTGARLPLQADGVAQAAGIYFLAGAIGVDFENISAAHLVLSPVLLHVRARAHRHVNFGAVGVGQQVTGPVVVVAALGQVEDALTIARDFGGPRLVGEAQHAVGVGHVEVIAHHQHAKRLAETFGEEGGAQVGLAVVVGVAQQRDAVCAVVAQRARFIEPEFGGHFERQTRWDGAGFGYQHVAVGQHVQPAGAVELASVLRYDETSGRYRRFAGRPGLNVDAVGDGLGGVGRGQVHRIGSGRSYGLGRRVGGGFLFFLFAGAAAGSQQGQAGQQQAGFVRRHHHQKQGIWPARTAGQLLFYFRSPNWLWPNLPLPYSASIPCCFSQSKISWSTADTWLRWR